MRTQPNGTCAWHAAAPKAQRALTEAPLMSCSCGCTGVDVDVVSSQGPSSLTRSSISADMDLYSFCNFGFIISTGCGVSEFMRTDCAGVRACRARACRSKRHGWQTSARDWCVPPLPTLTPQLATRTGREPATSRHTSLAGPRQPKANAVHTSDHGSSCACVRRVLADQTQLCRGKIKPFAGRDAPAPETGG